MHGMGLAIDVGNRFGGGLSCADDEFIWMQQNAHKFGWKHPEWAQCGKTGEEAWHWEYTGEIPG
jgi:LAS superfamily LD-carboxypeptidase LdcB